MKDSSHTTVSELNPTTETDVMAAINNKAREILACCPTKELNLNISALLKVLALHICTQYSNWGRNKLDQDEVDDALEKITEILSAYIFTDTFQGILDKTNKLN